MSRTALPARLAATGVSLVLAAGTLAACSSDGGEDPPASKPTATTSSAAETPSAKPDAPEPDDADAQSDAIDAYVKAAQPQIEKMTESFDGLYSEVSFTGTHPDTVEYHYTFAEQQDADAAVKAFEKYAETLQGVADSTLFPEMARAGITVTPKVVYTYDNADGTELWSRTFEPS